MGRRIKKIISISLSRQAKDLLDGMASKQDRPRSHVVEDLIIAGSKAFRVDTPSLKQPENLVEARKEYKDFMNYLENLESY